MLHKLLKVALCGLISLTSSLLCAAPADLSVKSISVPAYNLITDTLIGMTPQVKGKRNEFMMQLVCDLARGSRSQQQVNEILKQNNVDVEGIPPAGNAMSLLVNNDKRQQQTACVSFIATSIFYPSDNSVFFNKKKDDKGVESASLDHDAFAREMKVRMSIAQATAQFYAVIANNLKKDKNMTWVDHQQDVANITESYAPEFLNSIKNIFNANQATYTPVAITVDGLDVIDSRGLELVQTPNISVLKSRGVDWLGNGKILGKEYFVDIRVMDAKPVGKGKTKK